MSQQRGVVCAILALALSIVPGTARLSASGESEDPLADARKLLSEGRLSEALSLNMDVFLTDAEQQDAVLKLLDGILRKSKEFNQTIQRFAEIDFGSPEGIEEGKGLLADLRRIDSSSNPETGRILDLLGSRLVFEETGRAYRTLMDSVLPLVRAERYHEAAEAYLEGFRTLARDSFDSADYETELEGTPLAGIRADVLSAVASVETAVREAVGRRTSLEAALESVSEAARERDAAGLTAALPAMLRELDELDLRRDAIAAAAALLEQYHAALFRERELYDNFIWYSVQLIVGRTEVPGAAGAPGGEPGAVREGIFKALEMQWERTATSVADRMERESAELLAQGRQAYRAGDHRAVSDAMDRLYGVSLNLNRVLRTWGTQFRIGSGLKPTSKGWSVIASILPRMIAAQELAKESALYLDLDRQASLLEAAHVIESAAGSEAVAALKGARSDIASGRARLAEISSGWSQVAERYEALAGSPAASPGAVASALAALGVVGEMVGRFDREDTRLAEIHAAAEHASYASELDRLSSNLAVAKGEIAGVEVVLATVRSETGEEIRTTRTERYPAKARDILSAARGDLATLRLALEASGRAWGAEKPHVLASAMIQRLVSRNLEILGAAAGVGSAVDAEIALAEQAMELAAQHKSEGIGHLDAARASLEAARRSSVRTASDRFRDTRYETQLAAKSLDSSLGYAEDPEARRLRDVEILALQDDIGRAEIQIAIQEVRRFLAEGKRLFNLGDYLRANDEYKRAESRWNEVSSSRNAEIDFALKSVENALLYQTQRVITTDNPIYDVVMQLYNNAREAYNDGSRLLGRGLKVDGLSRLNDAERTLARMRELVPYYQPMGVLALEIIRLRDPGEFGRVFAQRFSEAAAKTSGRPGEALSELQDLREIDPRYRGLDDAIHQAKLKLGLIAPPPKPQDTTRSVQLTSQARAIYVSRQSSRYPAAVALLDQAIALWDTNPDATALKDIITGLLGGQRPLVLPNDAEQQYQQARSLFGRKDYFGAKAIIDQLMKDPVAKNYLPLIELKRRVDLETS